MFPLLLLAYLIVKKIELLNRANERCCLEIRVNPTGFLQSDLAAKLKIDEF